MNRADISVEPTTSANTTVVVGVDTHRDLHVAHASDQLGRPLDTYQIPTTTAGYQQLLDWAQGHGQVQVVAIEGIGHYGTGLGRHLHPAGIQVTEVGRPNRQRRARHSKTDANDAAGAAAMVLAGDDLGEPKTADADIESLRILRATRTGAVRARPEAVNALKALIATAPAARREELTGLHKKRLLEACKTLDQTAAPIATPHEATAFVLASLARRCRQVDEEIHALDRHIDTLTARSCAALRAIYGIGADTAAPPTEHSATTHNGSAAKPPSPNSAPSSPSKHPAESASDTDTTSEETATPTAPCTSSASSDSAVTNPPATTSPAESPKAK